MNLRGCELQFDSSFPKEFCSKEQALHGEEQSSLKFISRITLNSTRPDVSYLDTSMYASWNTQEMSRPFKDPLGNTTFLRRSLY